MVSGVIEQVWLELDEFVEAFELAWIADAVPEITDFLPPAEHPQFRETLLELVRVDLELRWQHGCAKTIDDYRCEFPVLFDDAESLSQIAFEEFRARRQAGEPVMVGEYASRFGICTDNWPATASADQHEAPASGYSHNGSNHSLARRASSETTSNRFPEVGSDLLGFHLQSELGRGAFSRVYLARQGDLANRLVVLKVSSDSFAEADKLAQLQHANIVPIYSVHRAGQLSAVCMPYFGSATLADVVRDVHGLGSLPPSGRVIVETLNACGERTAIAQQGATTLPYDFRSTENGPGERGGVSPPVCTHDDRRNHRGTDAAPLAKSTYDGALKTLSGLTYVEAVLWIGAKLANGLSHAHERGILHRDLKPANVLMADDGRPMLLDFNLSADLKQSASVREMLVGGTLPYMAPEQIHAFQHRVHSGDARSDIFSLGVILFELLAGRNPFPNRQGALEKLLSDMLQDRMQTPPELRSLNPAATPAVEAIVHRCLEPDPTRRYQTAADLLEDLERHLKQLPLRHTREPSLRERTQKWTQRNSRLTAIISFALVVGGVSLAVGAHRENKRITAIELEVAQLMNAGQQALDDDEADVAHGRFLAAWMKVQAEPALGDHQPGVAGWLDHSRRAVVQKQWQKRVHPREFDDRRDEALLLSLYLTNPKRERGRAFHTTENASQVEMNSARSGASALADASGYIVARDALLAASELTIPGDPGWTRERELLTLVEADLIVLASNAEQALKHLEATSEFSSRLFHERRATLLEQLGRSAEAEQARHKADQLPLDQSRDRLLSGMTHTRRQEFDLAELDFELVLNAQPDAFHARLFQAICFLNLNRHSEAKVALTACIAQRPQFQWSYFFRSQANAALADHKSARADLRNVLEMNPPESLKRAAVAESELVHEE